jgi:hypothetical protein
MQGLVQKLRRKYRNNCDTKHSKILTNIVGLSIPVVYGSHLVMGDAQRKLDNVKRARARIRSYIRGMIDTFCYPSVLNKFNPSALYLVSLTFDDLALNLTSRATRDKYCRDFLNSVTLDYFACLDFGKENNREHYHAIIVTDEPLFLFYRNKKGKEYLHFANDDKQWKYGFYSVRKINIDPVDQYKTLNYAFKSSNYAFKSADDDNGVRPFHKRGVVHLQEPNIKALPF